METGLKKKLITLLFMLSSCGYNAVDYSKGAIITDIESRDNGCYYYTSNIKSNRVSYEGYFFDKCGIYNVGDTVKLINLNNKNQ